MTPRRLALPAAALCALLLSACGSPAAPSATRLALTPEVTATLLAAGAGAHGLTTADYRGLRPGDTYYAWDRSDHLYWAGAALVPSPHSMRAEVSAQDDGGYDLFTRPKDGTWSVYEDGLGNLANANCSIVVPSAVRKVWGWPLHTPCGAPQGI